MTEKTLDDFFDEEPSLPKVAKNKNFPGERVSNPFKSAQEEPAPGAPIPQTFGGGSGLKVEERNSFEDLTIDDLLHKVIEQKSSDLHLTVGQPPMIRTHGDIHPMANFPALSNEQINTLVSSIMSKEQQTTFAREHDLDLAYSIPGLSRFRVNVMKQRKQVGAVIRVIPNDIKTLAELNMPESFADFAKLPRGLVLVCGPTGSGKSTTLAAIINEANRLRHDHILTIEDPIEFVHENQKCIVTQREVGDDTASFAKGLRQALRQDPDIILVGELRDPETIQTAITAAETGHLVFGTLHTQSAAETMSRIIDSFPDGSKPQVRAQLAATVQGIVCQTLIKAIDGKGRVAATEVLKGVPSVRALIRKGQEEQIRSALETGSKYGMHTLDMNLEQLVLKNLISVDEAISKASSADLFIQQLGGEERVAQIKRKQEAQGGKTINRGM